MYWKYITLSVILSYSAFSTDRNLNGDKFGFSRSIPSISDHCKNMPAPLYRCFELYWHLVNKILTANTSLSGWDFMNPPWARNTGTGPFDRLIFNAFFSLCMTKIMHRSNRNFNIHTSWARLAHLNCSRLDRSNSRPLGPKWCSNALPYRRICLSNAPPKEQSLSAPIVFNIVCVHLRYAEMESH